ncbi:pyridoxamine 5'-phosphate oxidase family protein [Candidatus Bipolaricaulota bacterium]
MTRSLEDVRQEVWSQLKDSQCVYLATAEADQPRVRPVTLLNIDQKFWIATSPRSAKARQILRNPNVEFCIPLSEECGNGYIRIAGVASVVTDSALRTKIGEKIPFLKEHWSGTDDPNLCLIRITRVEVEHLKPGQMEPDTFIV